MLTFLNGASIAELPYNDYFEYFGPDFKLHISPSNMTNQNTQEYMDKIKYVLVLKSAAVETGLKYWTFFTD